MQVEPHARPIVGDSFDFMSCAVTASAASASFANSPTAMGVLMPVTEPIADIPSPLLLGAGSPLGTRRLAAECGHPLLEYLGGSDTSKILSYSWASDILLRTSRRASPDRRSAGFRKFTTITFHTLHANHTIGERPQHRKESWTATLASIDTSMTWTAPAGSTSMARVAKIASFTTARVEIRELTLFTPNVQFCECDLADERQRDWPASPRPNVMTAAAAVLCLIRLTLPSADNQSSAKFCESTTSTADTTWKQGSFEKRTNAKAESTICDDHKGPDTSRSNAIRMRPPRKSSLPIG
ncbi:hypothetical protein CNYM01_13002 [Colletotrichum nymphaeae SA-01]|uniref:Uncharacterized protein n=1 Tax=Colletotrichum nymphaeae SA-01 TaxID=1460502 RepID=A0A135S9X2_9PEZI|nr:hypothetical protein CNYM01_13002 [Colletotrichum nymphaeae SA-01]